MNVDLGELAISGYDDQPVPNQFLRQGDETATLAVLLPGHGYTAAMPLFYYSEWIALDRGWDVLRVDYDYRVFWADASTDERKQRLNADVDAALSDGLRQRDYDRIVLIGKSMGTRAMAHILSERPNKDVWNVWLTPLLNEPEVKGYIEQRPGQTFVAIGTEDFAYDQKYLEWLVASGNVEVVIIEDADHSMDVSGDILGSIQAMGQVMSKLDKFLPQQAATGSANA